VTARATYRVFGINLATSYPLRARPRRVDAAADVTFDLVDEEPDDVDWASAELRYSTPVASDRTAPDFHFFRLGDRDVIRIVGAADFHVSDTRIACHLHTPRHAYLVEIALFGLVLAFWCERGGTATYHAAAIALTDRDAVGFLASSGTGKSSMAAGLLAAGSPLVTEDLLVLTWNDGTPCAEPGLPQLRLWPATAATLVTDWERLEQPHPGYDKRLVPVGPGGVGHMSQTPVPLRRLYVLERLADRVGAPSIEAVSARSAVMELLRHSYLPHEASRFGWHAERLAQVTRLLEAVPLRRLRYPSGQAQLPAIERLLRHDLRD
jgi:hypothetical protein